MALQTDAPAHGFAYSAILIHSELGHSVQELFEWFEEEPFASGSIAQVHRAKLRHTGSLVAVKVRHPHISEQIAVDFSIMVALATLLEQLPGLRWLCLSETLAQFADTIAAQTNLHKEGENLRGFIHSFRRWRDIEFPVPLILSRGVLVETFLEGEQVSVVVDRAKAARKTAHLNGSSDQYRRLLELCHFVVTRGEDLYIKMLLQDNFVHADLHPGNILIRIFDRHTGRFISVDAWAERDESFEGNRFQFSIGAVDAGLVTTLSPAERLNFIGLVEVIGDGDGVRAAECVLQFSAAHKSVSTSSAFRRDMSELFRRVRTGYGNQVEIGDVLRGILALLREHRLSIDAHYATLVMNVLCLDGMARELLPAYNMLDAAKPLLILHRQTRRLPKSVAEAVMNVALPVLQVVKSHVDRKLLLRYKRDSKLEL